MPGYSVRLEDNKIVDELLCVLCKQLLREPVQTLCGHRCCSSCVKEWKGSRESFKYPADNELVSDVFPDRFVEREVLNLEVKCSNLEAGCEWRGLACGFDAHIATCPFDSIECSNTGCHFSLAKSKINKHIKDECLYRKIKCTRCDEHITAHEKKKHLEQECSKSKISCSQCGRQVIHAQLLSHQDTDCEQAIVRCPFSKVGCAATRPMKKQERRKHMDSALYNHVTYLLNFLLEIQSKLEALVNKNNSKPLVTTQVEELQAAFKEFKSQYNFVLTRVKDLEHQLPAANTSVKGGASAAFLGNNELSQNKVTEGLRRSLNHLSLLANESVKSFDFSEEYTCRISDIESKLHGYESLIDEQEKKTDDQKRTIDALKDWNHRLEGKVSSMEHELALKGITMVEQQEKLDVVEQTSYNGVLIWAINDFMKKRYDAITGKKVSLYSPEFYTGHHGYKLRVRIYLNGDGLGKGTHVSLFFVVCKGRYDALLSWPFRQKVTMVVLDQDNIEHVVDSFRPDPQSSSFQKPKNDMNVASGCPLFMSLANLDTRSYVRDDTMFVKVTVDISGLDHG